MYITRAGTKVFQPLAARLASSYENYHEDAQEFFVYRDFSHHGFEATAGDKIYVHDSDRTHDLLKDYAHVLNLVTGAFGLIPWSALEHNVKPVERKVAA